MTTAVVAGALANKPGNAGEAWVRMSWVAGLRDLGFDVLFVEECQGRAFGAVAGAGGAADAAGTAGPAQLEDDPAAAWFRSVTAQFGLCADAALVRGDDTVGMSRAELLGRLEDAELLVNLSGNLRTPALRDRPKRRVFVDLDPGFTQLWHAAGDDGAALAGHDHHFTVGEHVGSAQCPLPTGGIRWRPVRQPVVLEHWPVAGSAPERGFTTVATWRTPFGRPSHAGRQYGLKLHEFRRFFDIPGQVDVTMELALAIDPAEEADLGALAQSGWRVVDPQKAAGTVDDFRAYVGGSTGEFSCAQGVYVETRSGWLSDRTARYLASGRPAVVQDTGIGDRLPVGEGLLCFDGPDQAVHAVSSVVADYERHAKAARLLAEEHFAAPVVLGRFLEDVGVAP